MISGDPTLNKNKCDIPLTCEGLIMILSFMLKFFMKYFNVLSSKIFLSISSSYSLFLLVQPKTEVNPCLHCK